MSFPSNLNATGSLFEAYDSGQSLVEDWGALHRNLSQGAASLPGWLELTYSSSAPLISDTLSDPDGMYHHYFLLRRSRRRFLIVSSDSDLVGKLLDVLQVRKRLFAPSVDIARRPRSTDTGKLCARCHCTDRISERHNSLSVCFRKLCPRGLLFVMYERSKKFCLVVRVPKWRFTMLAAEV